MPRLLAGLVHYVRSRTATARPGSRRTLNGNPVVASCVYLHAVGRDNESRRRLSGDGKVLCPKLGQMEALRETIPGSPERKRHKRCCQGACAVHE
jgi:hypothetical protein